MVLAWYNKNINKDEGLDGCGGASCFHLWCPCLWSVSGCMAAVHNSAWEVQKRKKRIHHFNIYYFESLAGNLVVPDWFCSVLNNDSGTVWTNFGVNVYVLQVLIVYQIPKGSFSLGRGGGISADVRCSKPWWKRQKANEVRAFASGLCKAVSSETEWNKLMIWRTHVSETLI